MSRRRASFACGCAAFLAITVAGPGIAQESGFGSWFDRVLGNGEDRPVDEGVAADDAASIELAQAGTKERGEDGFRNWVKRFRSQARAAGIDEDTYDRAMAVAHYDQSVIDAASRQAEFVKPIWEYLETAVSQKRIENGRRMKAEHSETLDRIEKRFGVDRHVVLAIWGMESSYGSVLDDPDKVRPVVSALGTLAYAGGRRSKFGRTQLVAALKILERGDVTPTKMTGSWAGAMGHTQFIPTTYLAYAVDMDGDKKRNIWSSIPDALASTANYLRRSGWRTGETWGYEVAVPSDFNTRLADRKTYRTMSQWERLGLRRTQGREFPSESQKAALFLPAGTKGPGFLILTNFRAILRYNNANAYALAVGHLSDRIAGGGPFQQAWPRDTSEGALAEEQRRELQALLAAHGHDPGTADGDIGPKTEAAIRAVQNRLGLPEDGQASIEFLKRLRAESR